MTKPVPSSLAEAIEEEPDRFIEIIDRFYGLDRIANSENPYKEFMLAFEESFGYSTGLNLWQYALNKYQLFNQVYKNDEIQEKLPKEYKGPLKRKEAREFWEQYHNEKERQQNIRESLVKKPVKVSSYNRKGKEISTYRKTKGHQYSKRQELFLQRRPDQNLDTLADNFNQRFGTSLTKVAIRDKRLRLLGKK